MLAAIRNLLRRVFRSELKSDPDDTSSSTAESNLADIELGGFNAASRGSQISKDAISAVAYDPELLDRARMQWQFGEWESLVQIDQNTLESHPERAKLALLVASAHQQVNDHVAARRFVKISSDWGCDKKLIAQLLIAGVHNTLGKAATLLNDDPKALQHFRDSVVGVSGDRRLAGQARAMHEMAQLGLKTPDSSLWLRLGRDPRINSEAKGVGIDDSYHPTIVKSESKIETTDAEPRHSKEAYVFYERISRLSVNKSIPPFIMIDSKSLPRSGLHYMKKTFESVLSNNFSFCEWYWETGCCKKMPCALTGYAKECERTKTSKLRMTKSHDFDCLPQSTNDGEGGRIHFGIALTGEAHAGSAAFEAVCHV